ncbi:ammonia-dependent NAD(+) synthetase [Anaerobacillus alkaliphilus]|uniref:NH(3)-dependent NAD(+) synthetase n=1 Tax=Anaerobacillus alkaliphilus TaxID=1548597 RepID=A0A4V1LG67_9BACI|nr:ammonia-dependent NAD(+) synthetase [Anaerobacillus alkaliphilus]RXI98704.1 ammonia-dependent NAD(+) synthetase [Anaerobacillus alkaliphilus]
MQNIIIEAMKVKPTIDVTDEISKRVQLLKEYLVKTNTKGYVLGISGGQDSTLAGKLCQMAVDELNEEQENDPYMFIAVRLPYGEQQDEQDAQDAIQFINPTKKVTVNIKAAVDASVQAFTIATGETLSNFMKGNTKARERMKVQYDVGAYYQCLVVGTDHSAEAITGFFTKHGDGACDIVPLFGLNKRQGKQLLQHVGCPEHLYLKAPTADLEDDKPGLPDEVALGFTYENIDDYLEGKQVPAEIQEKIEMKFKATEHKRQGAVSIYDTWWK